MGDVDDDILTSFGLTKEEKKTYDTVVAKFQGHFVKKRNLIFERVKFNQHKQEEGKSVDDFVTVLYSLSEHCQYAELQDEMICDRIVVGLHDSSLSEKLQLKADLTLEKPVTSARQQESVKKQQKVTRAEESSSNVDAIHSKQMQVKTNKSVLSNKQAHKQNPVSQAQTYVLGMESIHIMVSSS